MTRLEDDFVVVDNGMVDDFVMIEPRRGHAGSTSDDHGSSWVSVFDEAHPRSDGRSQTVVIPMPEGTESSQELNTSSITAHEHVAQEIPADSSQKPDDEEIVQEPATSKSFVIVDKPTENKTTAGIGSASTNPSVGRSTSSPATPTRGDSQHSVHTTASIPARTLELCILLLNFRREFASKLRALRAGARNLPEAQASKLSRSAAYLENEADAVGESSEAALRLLRDAFERYHFVENDEQGPASANETRPSSPGHISEDNVLNYTAEDVHHGPTEERNATSPLSPLANESMDARRLSEFQAHFSSRRPSWSTGDELKDLFPSSQESDIGAGPTREITIDWDRFHQNHCRPGEQLVNCRICGGWMDGFGVFPRG